MEIFLGIVSAIVIFLFREALIHARQQKEISARLFSYVTHWKSKLIQEDGLFKIAHIGMKWQKEERSHIQAGTNAKELIKIEEKYKEKINEILKKFEENSDDLTKEIKEGFVKLESSEGLKSEVLSMLRSTKESILSGKTFISDQDAAKLGHEHSFFCVSLKMHLISLIDSAIILLQAFDSKSLEYKQYKQLFETIFKEAILTSKDIELLSGSLEKYTESTVFGIAVRNINYGL